MDREYDQRKAMENLKALISGRKLTNYQRALAKIEFEGMLKIIEMYEKTVKNNATSPHVVGRSEQYCVCEVKEPEIKAMWVVCLKCNKPIRDE